MSEATERLPVPNLYAAPRSVTDLNECVFYHAMDLPMYGSVAGYWDLRGNEAQYLGNVPLTGKRVLEIGPASGHISFFMEREGAEVVSVEASEDFGWELCWDIPEHTSEKLAGELAAHREMMRRLRNSYWLAHRAFASKAKVHYGSAYSIPVALGQFDISVIGCVLLHNKQPLRILENCARLTKETVVVVEVFRDAQLAQTPAVFLPAEREPLWHTWWSFSPVYFVNVLRSMGFTEQRVTFHKQICHGAPADLFTIVASRQPPYAVADAAGKIDVQINSAIAGLNATPGQLIRLPVTILNRGEVPLSSSTNQPVRLSYHWRNESGETVVWEGLRTHLPRTLYQGDREELLMTVKAPDQTGSYWLDISIVKEHVTWYDDLISGLPLRIKAKVGARIVE